MLCGFNPLSFKHESSMLIPGRDGNGMHHQPTKAFEPFGLVHVFPIKAMQPSPLERCPNPVRLGLESRADAKGVLQLGIALHRLFRGDHGEDVAAIDVPDSLRYDGVANLTNQNLGQYQTKKGN